MPQDSNTLVPMPQGNKLLRHTLRGKEHPLQQPQGKCSLLRMLLAKKHPPRMRLGKWHPRL
jgi:hypothetical protein